MRRSGGFSETDSAMRDRIRSVYEKIRTRFLLDVGFLWSGQGATVLLGFAQGIIVARILGPTDLGVAALVIAVPSLVVGLVSPQSREASMRFLGRYHARSDWARARAMTKVGVSVDLVTGLVTLAVVLGVGPWIATRFDTQASAYLLMTIVAASIVLRSPAPSARAVLLTVDKFATVGVIHAVASAARFVLIVSLVVVQGGVLGYVIGFAVANVFEAAFLTAVALREMRRAWPASWRDSRITRLRGEGREIARFLVLTDVGALFRVARQQLDVIVLGLLRGPTDVGYYRIGLSVMHMFGNIVTPLQSTAFQRMSRAVGEQGPRVLRSMSLRYLKNIGIPLALISAVSIPLMPLLVPLLYDDQFAPAVPAAQVLAGAACIWLLGFWARPALLTAGKAGTWAAISGVSAAVSIVGYFALIPLWGAVGAATATLLGTLASQAGMILALRLVWRSPRAGEPTVRARDDSEATSTER